MSYDRFLDRELDRVTDEQDAAEQALEDQRSELERLVGEIVALIGKDWDHSPGDIDGLGIAIARYFDWDARMIMRATYAALEDSNFHKLNAELLELAMKHKVA
jgi:hypothetical protein